MFMPSMAELCNIENAFAKYALQDQLTKAGLKGEIIIQEVA